jgi:hypothetical protein
MRTIYAVAVALSLLLGAGSAVAAGMISGNELYQDCNGEDELFCRGFLLGVFSQTARDDGVCAANNYAQAGQLQMIFLGWARRYPGRLSLNAADATIEAFRAYFPCH